MGRKRDPNAWIEMICRHCGATHVIRRSSKRQFCDSSCSNAWQHANGIRTIGFDSHKPWFDHVREKYGEEVAIQRREEFKKTVSIAMRNADMSHQKDVASALLSLRNRENLGKTYEEIYGLEKAIKIREKLSASRIGAKNPAYGKVYTNSGKSVKGYYKGMFFRSLLEYSFMKHLEQVGIPLNEVDYECFIIPYQFEGRDRTYRIDFFVKEQKIVYEVKPAYVLKRCDPLNETKWRAARIFCEKEGYEFKIVTEFDFLKIKFDEARKDTDIVWKEETFKFFRSHQ